MSAVFLLVGLLCLDNANGISPFKQTCIQMSTKGRIKRFYSSYSYGSSFYNEFPCSYKLTSMRCGRGVEALVWGENSWDEGENPYMNRVTVNITDKKTKTSQINTISLDSIAQFLKKGDAENDTPWEWSCSDCPSQPDTYITGRFNRTSRVADIIFGAINITFESSTKTLYIFCSDEDNFKSFEGYCHMNKVYTYTPLPYHLDPHHYDGLGQEAYTAFVEQHVPQLKPLCQEAARILTSRRECPDVGEVLFECWNLFELDGPLVVISPSVYNYYGTCIRRNGMDRFKVYVTCLRLLCKTATSQTPAAEDCDLLQKASDKCPGSALRNPVHTSITALMSRAGCSGTVTTPAPTSTEGPEPLELGTPCTEKSECGNNARCKGTPTVCTCKSGYVSNDGKHCGRLVGKSCSHTWQCVTNAECKDGTCQCLEKRHTVSQHQFCVRRLGRSCSTDCECVLRAACVEGQCTCRSGYVQPDDDDTQCKLAAGQECQRNTDCGVNARCTGRPPRCTCLKGYIDELGRCGKPLGSNCTDVSECVKHTRCGFSFGRESVCSCDYSYVQYGDFCYRWLERCEYNSLRGRLRRFYESSSNSPYFYAAFPCRYKMADIQCSGARVLVTLNHAVEKMRSLGRKRSSGGIHISDVTVNVTTTNDDGSMTSQINKLDVQKFKTYLQEGRVTVSPWDWSYSGSAQPEGTERIEGVVDVDQNTAQVLHGGLTVDYDPRERSLSVVCRSLDFRAAAHTHHTICGSPGGSDKALLRKLQSKSDLDWHHTLTEGVLDTYATLVTQDMQQTSLQCREAKRVLTDSCENLGESLYDCYSLYKPSSTFFLGGCLRQKGMDNFELFVACMRVLCGQTGGDREESCATFHTAQDACGSAYSHLSIPRLMKIANCNTTTTTRTTPTP